MVLIQHAVVYVFSGSVLDEFFDIVKWYRDGCSQDTADWHKGEPENDHGVSWQINVQKRKLAKENEHTKLIEKYGCDEDRTNN